MTELNQRRRVGRAGGLVLPLAMLASCGPESFAPPAGVHADAGATGDAAPPATGAGGMVVPVDAATGGAGGSGGSGGMPPPSDGAVSDVAEVGGPGTGGAGGGSMAACAANQRSTCTASAGEIACHFGGAPGNYEVTVELGGAAAGDAYVEAESHRRMLAQTVTQAGQTKQLSFVTNVRVYEGEPVRPDQDSTYPKGTPGLDIYVRGTAAALASICQRPATPLVTLWIAGDSTVCDQAGTDFAGWGQHLPQFLLPPISVANYADSGEGSTSFLRSAKLWGAIRAGMKAGDWVFIQLGHNDKDTPAATFRANLTAMLTDVKNVGAHAVLLTPISRVGYTLAAEHVNSTGANLPQIIRDLGTSAGVPVIDLTVTTWNWLQTIRWQDYFALGTDHTHTSPRGAGVIAGFVRDGVRAKVPALEPYLR